jgi:hypothetical protein
VSERIASLRERYRPEKIRVLFVAESPPDSGEGELRFFYNASQERHDHMYRSLMEAAFPDFKHRPGEKEGWLRKFQQAGYYMIDATDRPVNHLSPAERRRELNSSLETRIAEIGRLIVTGTPIVLVKRNIFEMFSQPLRDAGHNVIHETFLPFPSHGHQARFIEACSKCLLTGRGAT